MPRRSASYGGDGRKSKKDLTDAAAKAAAAAVQPSLPEEEPRRAAQVSGAESKPGVPHDEEHSAVSQQILNFLLGLKTLKRDGVESRQQLEQALYAKRFELLFTSSAAKADTATEATAEVQETSTEVAVKASLPQFHTLPQQQLLKEFLMSGKLLGGHQSVAHVLYPDAVHWPHQLGTVSTDDEDGVLKTDRSAVGVEPSASRPGTSGGPARRQSAEIGPETEENQSCSEEEEKVEVVICGKRVQSTVRGRALKDVMPEPGRAVASRHPNGAVQPLPEARFRAAQDARKQLERAVKMEEYQERRIADRIQALEIALDDELFHQEELRKREKQRERRHQELKKDLDKQIALKMEAEKAQREEEKRQREREKKEKERLERYYKAQKEKVEQWQAEMSSDDFFQDPKERARRRRAMQEKEHLQNVLADEERRNQNPPLKRLEVEAKLQEQEDCLDHRPFVAPKAHDQPRPILQMIADSKAKPKAKAFSKRGAWKKEAEGVSKRYGLSAEHLRTIEAQLQRTAGRFRPETGASAPTE